MSLLTWAIIFLVLAVLAGVFGFRGIARVGCLVSRIFFFILTAGFVIFLILYLVRIIF